MAYWVLLLIVVSYHVVVIDCDFHPHYIQMGFNYSKQRQGAYT